MVNQSYFDRQSYIYYHELTEKLSIIRKKCIDNRIRLEQKYLKNGSIDSKTKLSGLRGLNVCMSSLHLSLTFVYRHLLFQKWWILTINNALSDEDKVRLIEGYLASNKLSYVISLFSSVESFIRTLLREKNHDINNKNFRSCINTLLSEELTTPIKGGIQVLEFFSEIRNTIHNDGTYYSSKNKSRNFKFKDETYTFSNEVRIDFVTWELLIEITDSILSIMIEILDDKNFS